METSQPNIAMGLVFDADLESGGGYQQSLSTLLALSKLPNARVFIVVFSRKNQQILRDFGLDSLVCRHNIFLKALDIFIRFHPFLTMSLNRRLLPKRFAIKTTLEALLEAQNADICYFLSPSNRALTLQKIPYIFTLWDLSHLDCVEFPEVRDDFQLEMREILYTRALKKAVAIITDSRAGAENAARRYSLDSRRIFACHFAPSINTKTPSKTDIKAKYGIRGEYIYYPAQGWAHKNHAYILEALALLKRDGIEVSAIFSGSDKGNLDFIKARIAALGLDSQVKHIGFAPNDEISALYTQSLALVMPTYFGPTNIPPLEAFALKTPVIYSDILREQTGDAALLCDLSDPSSLATHIKALLGDPALRKTLAEKGSLRLAELNKIGIESVVGAILRDFAIKRSCWGR